MMRKASEGRRILMKYVHSGPQITSGHLAQLQIPFPVKQTSHRGQNALRVRLGLCWSIVLLVEVDIAPDFAQEAARRAMVVEDHQGGAVESRQSPNVQ
jgi:hypothetical protein